jgi:hypothetical protein
VHERPRSSRKHENHSQAERFVAAAALVLVLASASPGQIPGKSSRDFLLKYANFSQTEFVTAEKGQTVAKILTTKFEAEVAAFGMVAVQVPADYFVGRFRDIESFKKSPEVLEIGKFSSTPCLEDLARLTIDPADLAALKRCRVGDCDVKLTSEMIENIRREEPKDNERVATLYRRMLVDYVRSYLTAGNLALATYRDKRSELRMGDEFRSLLEASPYLQEYVPDFQKHLEQPAAARLPDAEEFIYWSKEKWGLKAVVSITHVTIHRPPGGDPWPILVASKQIYASHYFTSSLGLSAFLESPGGSTGGRAYLMYLNRSRADLLGGGLLGALKRAIVKRSVRSGLEKNLELTRERLEREYRLTAVSPMVSLRGNR